MNFEKSWIFLSLWVRNSVAKFWPMTNPNLKWWRGLSTMMQSYIRPLFAADGTVDQTYGMWIRKWYYLCAACNSYDNWISFAPGMTEITQTKGIEKHYSLWVTTWTVSYIKIDTSCRHWCTHRCFQHRTLFQHPNTRDICWLMPGERDTVLFCPWRVVALSFVYVVTTW